MTICWDEKAVVKMVLKISLPYPITKHSCTYIRAVKPRIVIVSLSYGKWMEIKAQQLREQTFILTDVPPAFAWKVDKNKK